ncbi:hypothetical protein SLEP1_g37777 [Rubroshorea leprosula]|uniref:Uncharacterized protein n=1 Tax=Rubroshorea leprosula TaxID=152421 RepID=A0AAV5KVY3_9ROSI|nr:hypothetical protein SLEP1_g37777 [Rubroshorea leprosula]
MIPCQTKNKKPWRFRNDPSASSESLATPVLCFPLHEINAASG